MQAIALAKDGDWIGITNNNGFTGFFHRRLINTNDARDYIINDLRAYLHLDVINAEIIYNELREAIYESTGT
jgi:hypothetical protein